jgi:CRP/FNR family cyclic AMP-dependent transcriptional regulator
MTRRADLSAGKTEHSPDQRRFQRSYEPGEIIFNEGDDGIDLYVIQSGAVQITRGTASRPEVVADLGAGDFFGEMSVVLGEARTASAVAVGQTDLLAVDGETLEVMCIERPEIGIRMIQRLAVRLIAAERRLAVLSMDEVVCSLARYLAGQAGEALQEELRMTTSLRDLASAAALTMQETHLALHQLMDQKLIRLIGDELIAPDPAALSSAINGR